MIAEKLARGWLRARRSAVVIGALATIVRMGANVLLLPIILHHLTDAEFALWAVFVALGALGNLADFGFGLSIIRIYSYLWAGADDFDSEGLRPITGSNKPNFPRIHEFNASVARLYYGLGALAAVFLLFSGPWFVASSEGVVCKARMLYCASAAYGFSAVYNLVITHWALACQGMNQVRETQKVHLISSLVFMLSATVLLILNFGLLSLVCASLLRVLIMHLLFLRVYRRAAPGEHFHPRTANMAFLKRLWPGAWKLGVISLAVYLAQYGTVLISRALLTDKDTASFSLTAQVAAVIANLAALWLSVKWPEITILRAQGELKQMSTLFARRLTLTLVSYAGMAAMLVLIGNWLLSLKGTETRFLPAACLIVYLAYVGQQTFSSQFVTLTFTENVVPFYMISLLTGIGLVAISIPLTRAYGVWGLVVAPILAAIPATSWYPVWRGFRGQAFTVREFIRVALWLK